jgi:hypothetical protein
MGLPESGIYAEKRKRAKKGSFHFKFTIGPVEPNYLVVVTVAAATSRTLPTYDPGFVAFDPSLEQKLGRSQIAGRPEH